MALSKALISAVPFVANPWKSRKALSGQPSLPIGWIHPESLLKSSGDEQNTVLSRMFRTGHTASAEARIIVQVLYCVLTQRKSIYNHTSPHV